jgi:serine/threonine-protein kinase RsbW
LGVYEGAKVRGSQDRDRDVNNRSPKAVKGSNGNPLHFQRQEYSLRFRLSLPSTKPALNRGVQRVMRMARECGYLSDHRTDLEIALREALANAMIHGNDLKKAKRVYLRCYGHPNSAMMIFVRDEGSGFDPGEVPDPRQADRLHLDCGRGLLLMRELMDHVEYRKGGREVMLYTTQCGSDDRS